MENYINDFLGTGWKFPIEFNKKTGTVEMLSGVEDIENSLMVLFQTAVNERVMLPEYGSGIEGFLFMHVNRSNITYLESIISNAILFHEPRIILDDLAIIPSEINQGLLEITITYTIGSTNNRYNYVYPFYLNEATNLEL